MNSSLKSTVSPEEIGVGIDRLLKTIKNSDCLPGGIRHVLVVSPPPLKAIGIFATMFEQAEPKSRELVTFIGRAAAESGAHFLHAGEHILSSDIDGMQFDVPRHENLGRAIARIFTHIADVAQQKAAVGGEAALPF